MELPQAIIGVTTQAIEEQEMQAVQPLQEPSDDFTFSQSTEIPVEETSALLQIPLHRSPSFHGTHTSFMMF